MAEWKEYRLSDFIDINPKVQLKGKSSYSFVEMRDLNESQKYVPPSQERDLKGGARFKNGDTLFARITPCLENGKICQVKGLKDNVGFGSTEFLVFRGREEISHTDFIYYLARYDAVRKFAEQNMVGTSGRQRIAKDAFENLMLELPDYETQTAIAEILSSLDDKIELNNQINKNLEALAQALFKQWFVDFEFPNENGLPYKSSGGEMVESELGEIPKGWRVGILNDLADVKGGKRMPNGFDLTTNITEHPYIRVRDFSSGKVDISNLLYVPESAWEAIKNYTVSKNDIYITIVGTIGLVGLIPPQLDGANLTENAAKIISNQQAHFSKYFISLYLNSNKGQDEIKARTVGSTQPKLAIFRIREIPVVIPSRDCLENFDLIIEDIFTTIFMNDAENNDLTKLRDIILPKLISGELEVQNV